MATPQEPDFPPGHPKRCDYDPTSAEAKAWARQHYAPKGERDYPVGHIKAVDTPGNSNSVPVLPGIDPQHPELQAFTGRTPAQVAALDKLNLELAAEVPETPPREPIEAPPPPPPGSIAMPAGQPGS